MRIGRVICTMKREVASWRLRAPPLVSSLSFTRSLHHPLFPPSLSLSLSTCIDNFYPPIVDLWLNPRCPGRPIVWLCYFATRAYDLALFTRLPTFVDLFHNAFSIRPIKSFRQLRAVSTVPSINVFISLWIFLRHFGWEHAIVLRHLLRF